MKLAPIDRRPQTFWKTGKPMMTVSIHWRPADDKGTRFRGGLSYDLETLKKIFPGGRIEAKDAPTLRAIAKATERDFFNEVADVVECNVAIEYWGEW